jgi:predicted ArsR family transcriptional regulator
LRVSQRWPAWGLASRADFRNNGVVKTRRALVSPRPAPADDGELARGTRDRIVQILLQDGPSTTSAVAERLGLTDAAVRRHLDGLLEEGLVESRAARPVGHRGRGRPARIFALTDAGHDSLLHQGYDSLAADALRFLAESGGPDAVMAFAHSRVEAMEARYAVDLAGLPAGSPERVGALARALTRDGFAASTRPARTDGGEQLCQHHCPVAHVAAQFPQLCEAETQVFARLLDVPVQRLATIARGDGICTTHVSASHRQTAPGRVPGRTS